LGLGSVAMGRWIQNHKNAFLAVAVLLMTASLASAIREKIVKGKNSGIYVFGVAFVATAALLVYTRIKNGYLY
jgi:uncharacterized membrane protein